jgi:hypothetical protein
MNAFFVKACKGGGRSHSVEAVAVVKQAKFHKGVLAAIWLESKARNLSKRNTQRAKH